MNELLTFQHEKEEKKISLFFVLRFKSRKPNQYTIFTIQLFTFSKSRSQSPPRYLIFLSLNLVHSLLLPLNHGFFKNLQMGYYSKAQAELDDRNYVKDIEIEQDDGLWNSPIKHSYI